MTPRRALDGLNFCLADAANVLGPFLGIYLLTSQHWDQAAIGLVAMVGGLAALAAQLPMGALIDAVRCKRAVLVAAQVVISAAALVVVWTPTTGAVLLASALVALAGALNAPAIAALTLGLFGRSRLAAHTGRNSAFDHAGNVAAALAAGGIGLALSQRAVFLLVPLFCLLGVACVLAIPGRAIDHARARGSDGGPQEAVQWRRMLRNTPLLLFAVALALFHLANAAMMPLVGQRLALAHAGYETALMSACIVGAQLVMLPVALYCGARADSLGRKPMLLAAFAVLGLRGLLYTLADHPAWLLGVQLLDGLGAGVLGVMVPLIVADLTQGSGRYNASLGAVMMVAGIGAALSNGLAGAIVVSLGYDAAFIALAAIAFAALVLVWRALPETRAPAAPAVAVALAGAD